MSDTLLNWGLAIATSLVVIGVVLDSAETIRAVIRKRWAKLTCAKRVEVIGFALLVLGLAGEWSFSSAIHTRDAGEIEFLIGKNSALEKALDRQSKKIAEADGQLDDVSDSADDAEAQCNKGQPREWYPLQVGAYT